MSRPEREPLVLPRGRSGRLPPRALRGHSATGRFGVSAQIVTVYTVRRSLDWIDLEPESGELESADAPGGDS